MKWFYGIGIIVLLVIYTVLKEVELPRWPLVFVMFFFVSMLLRGKKDKKVVSRVKPKL